VDDDRRPIGSLDLLELAVLDIDTIEREATDSETGTGPERPA
jgi:hypothetical protein